MKGLFHIHLGLLLILFASCVKEEAEPQSRTGRLLLVLRSISKPDYLIGTILATQPPPEAITALSFFSAGI